MRPFYHPTYNQWLSEKDKESSVLTPFLPQFQKDLAIKLGVYYVI